MISLKSVFFSWWGKTESREVFSKAKQSVIHCTCFIFFFLQASYREQPVVDLWCCSGSTWWCQRYISMVLSRRPMYSMWHCLSMHVTPLCPQFIIPSLSLSKKKSRNVSSNSFKKILLSGDPTLWLSPMIRQMSADQGVKCVKSKGPAFLSTSDNSRWCHKTLLDIKWKQPAAFTPHATLQQAALSVYCQ